MITNIVGIDEVGRGPLAGPVTVCACVVQNGFDFTHFKGIRDSKKLSPKKREEWFTKISNLKNSGDLDFAMASVPAEEIDMFGIAPAIRKALVQSLSHLKLDPKTTRVFLDGSLKAPAEFAMQETIIKGDDKIPVISAASIVAKVSRDKYMESLAVKYPAYGFEKHKGYGTAVHKKALRLFGLTPLHRKTFITL